MKNPANQSSGLLSDPIAPESLVSKILRVFYRRPKVILVILLSVSLLQRSEPLFAQAPQQFSFQGVARDAVGKIVANTNVTVRIKIHKDSPNGTVVFSETQIVETNSGGVFNLVIGGLAGGLNNINWGSDNCFIQSEIDIAGGSNFIDLGTTSLKSVPYALVSRQWINNVPIVQTGVLGSGPSLPTPSSGSNLIWHPKKAAFRAGLLDNGPVWGDSEIGVSSFAAGRNPAAKGENSVAMGHYANASNIGAVAIGTLTGAGGDYSVAIGRLSSALAESSNAIGVGLYAKSSGSIALGSYNNISDVQGAPLPTDRILQLGNGTSDASRSNAVTILRNGNFGIGNNAIFPQYRLDIGGRMRVQHSNNETAGIHFDNSIHNPDGFVGMKTDNEVGLYVNDGWRFWVNSSNAYVNGALVNTSDRRLKKEINAIGESLSSISSLKGYHYYWKDENQGKELQTGLIAQEVEEIFPELVTTDKDGFKAVNYIGLIPHLIEAVKELDKKTEEITALKKELAAMQEMNQKLHALEASVRSLLQGQNGTSTQTSK